MPLFNGTNHDEVRQFLATEGQLTAQQYPEVLANMFGVALAAQIATIYPPAYYQKPVLALAAALTDYTFACPGDLIDHWASAYIPVYAYEFNDRNAPEELLPYAGERSLSHVMLTYWTDFVASKAPNGAGVPTWTKYAGSQDNIQSFAPPSAHQETSFIQDHNCTFWNVVINP